METENINPWIQIWIRPKQTIRLLINSHPKKWILWLAIIGGMLSGSFLGFSLYDKITLPIEKPLLILSTLATGALFGILYLYLFGWLYTLIGSWFGGRGTFIQVKCAIGWGYYPFIIGNIVNLLELSYISNVWFLAPLGLLNLVIVIWGIVIFLNLIAEAHLFSVWRSILTFLVTFALVSVALMIVGLVVPLIAPLF